MFLDKNPTALSVVHWYVEGKAFKVKNSLPKIIKTNQLHELKSKEDLQLSSLIWFFFQRV